METEKASLLQDSNINQPTKNRKRTILTVLLTLIFIGTAVGLLIYILNDSDDVVSLNDKPNIIVIMMDDVGFTDVGYNGYKITGFGTPTMDKLANNGIKLNYHYVSICSPTRSSFLSSKYSWKTGLNYPAGLWTADHMDRNIDTISQILSNGGYSNLMLGKWHLGYSSQQDLPPNKGFDAALYHQWGAVDYYTHKVCNTIESANITIDNELKALFNSTLCGYDIYDEHYNIHYDVETYYEDLFVAYGLRFIEQKYHEKKPFFVYYSTLTPHEPITYPPLLNVSDIYNYDQCEIYNHLEGRKKLCQMMKYSDYVINKIVDKLYELDIYDNTIIAVFSDNGAAVYPMSYGQNLPLRGAKLVNAFEGNIRTHAFISGGYINRYLNITECEYNHLFHVTDWFPVFASIANINVSNMDIDGINIFDDILYECNNDDHEMNASVASRDEIIHIDLCNDGDDEYYEQTYIRTKEWKLIINSSIYMCSAAILPWYYNGFVSTMSNQTIFTTPNLKPYPNKTAYFILNEYENNTEGLFYSKCYENMSEFDQTKWNNTLFDVNHEYLLYHIMDDRIEACNVADQYPEIVTSLMQRINEQKIYYHNNRYETQSSYILSQTDSYDCDEDTTFMRTWAELDEFRSGVNYSNVSFNNIQFVWKTFISHKKHCQHSM
eukprot:65772_1